MASIILSTVNLKCRARLLSYLLLRALLYFSPRNFYCFIRLVSCPGTNIILISSWFQCYSWGTISLARYRRCMQTYVLFQYSILRDIVSKTSESLIRRVVNLAFRSVYILYREAVYTLCVIYAYNIIVLFQYLLNNVSSNYINLSACHCQTKKK